MGALGWLAVTLGTAGLGWGYADVAGLSELAQSPNYHLAAATLLAVGLFSSAYGISLPDARHDLVPIVLAVTVGVVLKASLIAGGMYLLFKEPRYAVLGIVVAQIDPLSVAAMRDRSGMSPRAKTILSAWSSFDDPVTTLLIIYAAGWVTTASGPATSEGTGGYGGGLLANLALAVGAFIVWCAGLATYKWLASRLPEGRRHLLDLGWKIAMAVVLLALVSAAIMWFLMLGLAIAGLFFLRTHIDWIVKRITWIAFLAAAFALGLLFTEGFDFRRALALGLLAFAAQAVAGSLLPARLPPRDRVHLALGQQNGITAMILAIVLESSLPGTVAIVAPAILIVNLLNLATNVWWDRPWRLHRPVDQPAKTPNPSDAPAIPDPEQARVNRTRG